jgi:hypothetical protein
MSASSLKLRLALLLSLAACGENQTPPSPLETWRAPPAQASCVPNLDGVLDAAEMQATTGVPISWIASPSGASRPVNLAGGVDAQGHRVWDWSAPASDDRLARTAASPLAGKWYAASFPGGRFTLPYDLGGALEAIYSQDEQGLWLHGMASAQQDPPEGRTLMAYDKPVAAVRFPLRAGMTWTATAAVRNATVRGLPYASTDTYEVTVDGSGRLQLPEVLFTQVHKVRTRVTLQPAVGVRVSRRQVSFLFECFGEVARATSLDNETQDDFTTAAEVRRMGL